LLLGELRSAHNIIYESKQPERTYELVPAGNHVARLYQIIHIGTNSYEYKGEMKKSDKVRLTFELCNER
jgi:hypothetical protein